MINNDDITWEMYCEYLNVPLFEPFKSVSNADLCEMLKDDLENKIGMSKLDKFAVYQDFLTCTMDKDYFLNSTFHKYLINKNRLDLINKILKDERDNG